MELLLEAWSGPAPIPPAARFAAGAAWLREIDAAVRRATTDVPSPAALTLCRQVVAQLGLPAPAVNPLVSRSLASHARLHP